MHFMAMKEHMPYKADTTRLRKKDAKHVSAAILKLMVKITSIFGSYDTEVLYEVIPNCWWVNTEIEELRS